ncbi:hypothetical protein AUQ39_05005 [Lacticaseibacillus casei]|uniref:DUF5082 domain-containing protein n=1 Tax=Lacticaseibacillus zeae TaxID=57037 RepID=A0A5R8LXT7_LACZE|nr:MULTISPECIES: DUF5082 family protein [Lacticaseibacillus]MDE3283255.1 DUF5082 domain-containing protein [Lacticaseibacillus casei]OLS09840.1 hypothetical protein AUQ39_05005 [Lacticaseibacillus casei]QVI31420.1 DUF5082 family protein [Lacticaseibacillus zeae]TLF42191.1 DUF5082 domain-containing protein [Lacticaseibacillus zeae]
MADMDILQALLGSTQSSTSDAKAKIRKLKEAKSKLEPQIEEYETLAHSLTSLKTSTSHSAFKGTRREKFDSNLQEMTSALKSEIAKHHDAIQSINTKIGQLEMQADSMDSQIGQLIEQIAKLATD